MKKTMGGGREVGGKNVEQLSELCVCGGEGAVAIKILLGTKVDKMFAAK